jgi:hypothetical protein
MSVPAISNKHDLEKDIFAVDNRRPSFEWLRSDGPQRLGLPSMGAGLKTIAQDPALKRLFPPVETAPSSLKVIESPLFR